MHPPDCITGFVIDDDCIHSAILKDPSIAFRGKAKVERYIGATSSQSREHRHRICSSIGQGYTDGSSPVDSPGNTTGKVHSQLMNFPISERVFTVVNPRLAGMVLGGLGKDVEHRTLKP